MSTEENEAEEKMFERISELERKLSKCMEERDRVLSALRCLVSKVQLAQEDYCAVDTIEAEKSLLDESRDWK